MRGLIGILVLLGSTVMYAQNGIVREILPVNDTIHLSGKTIVPGSISFTYYADSLFDIELDNSSSILFIGTRLKLKEVDAEYRYIPISLYSSTSRRSVGSSDSVIQLQSDQVFRSPGPESHGQLIPMGEVQSAGSLTRGFVVGSNRSMNVMSAMNLTFDGKITDDLSIKASITDQNVPYQPEGNTLRLNEISNVYFELYGNKHALKGGDLVFSEQSSKFLRYRRNVKGVAGSLNQGRTSAGFSVAKGRFTSVTIVPQDGVSGPYRIPPPEGLNFTVILANSERVFLDGNQLQRGWNNDYIIDYNTGELTFTSRIMITGFSRIRVEYEFSNPNGQKSAIFGHHEQTIGKSKVTFNMFQEKESKNSINGLPLSSDDKYAFSMLGENESYINRSSADSVGYQEDVVRYKKVSRANSDGSLSEVYEFSNDPDSAHYSVLFAFVGEGRGDYIRAESTVNGIIYQWVAPEDGVSRGDYQPEIKLKAPSRNTVMELGVQTPVSSTVQVYSNIAGSFNTRNQFTSSSEAGAAVNLGAVYNHKTRWLGYDFSAAADIEMVQDQFTGVERFRRVEFDRDWSFYPDAELSPASDRILTLSTNLLKDAENSFGYTLTTRKREESVDGHQHKLNIRQKWNKVRFISDAFLMQNAISAGNSDWKRLSADMSYDFGKAILGYRYGMDHNMIISRQDSVSFSDQYFNEHKVYLTNSIGVATAFEVSYKNRIDALPEDGVMKDRFNAHAVQAELRRRFNRNISIGALWNYRNVTDLWNGANSNALSARMDLKGNFLDRSVKADINYSVANGRELRREYVFLLVPTGEGTHTWRDDNENGVKELEEFYEAVNPDERNYVKVFVPTSEYVNAITNILNTRLSLQFPQSWSDKGGLSGFLSRFSNITSWNSNTRHDDPLLTQQFFSTLSSTDEQHLIAGHNNIRSTVFFNRGNPGFGFELGYFNATRKTLIRDGFEAQGRKYVDATVRFHPDRLFGVRLKVNSGSKILESDVFQNRNFQVEHYQLKPTFIWQPSTKVRVSTSYNFTRRWDSFNVEQPSFSISNEGSGEVRVSSGGKGSLQCQVRLIDVQLTGEPNNALGYELLQALQPGMNTTLSLAWVQSIINGLQMSVSYDGRKSGEAPLVHTGRMAVTALF